MGLTSPPPPRVPNPPSRFPRHGLSGSVPTVVPWHDRPGSGRGTFNAKAILEALREVETPKPLTREEHNRQEAEREVEMLLRGEGALYKYRPYRSLP